MLPQRARPLPRVRLVLRPTQRPPRSLRRPPPPVLSCRAPSGELALRGPTPEARDACAVAAAARPKLSRISPMRGAGAGSESGHPRRSVPQLPPPRGALGRSQHPGEAPRQGWTGSAARWQPRRARAALRAATRLRRARPLAPRGCGGLARAAPALDRCVPRVHEPSRARRRDFLRRPRSGARGAAAEATCRGGTSPSGEARPTRADGGRCATDGSSGSARSSPSGR